jgi:hypothetical protein
MATSTAEEFRELAALFELRECARTRVEHIGARRFRGWTAANGRKLSIDPKRVTELSSSDVKPVATALVAMVRACARAPEQLA